ncbi:leucine-rich repeat-containing protein 74B-like [Ostrinia furnacalis]|uniref:leucine-rich repeat-containing protein 74B-like n=1 Tax=Ostrinia furnacalis TaxID=93504 RepID=UPI0010405E72|nr:leucine-rich repeat-containing protein 74B-like [Ostrinia furnacalis]
MSSQSFIGEEVETEIVFEAEVEVSSEEPPMEEWSSYILELPEENVKKLLAEKGLYHAGSGEICGKYIGMSDSAIFRHLYYNYPAVVDPGITRALFRPEDPIIYPDDGQELYLAVCKEMNQSPVKIFSKGLMEEVIDLKYYCVNSAGVRPMSMALTFNRNVRVLNLADNFLSIDACYHLGQMLAKNTHLEELNISGCRIGPVGAKRLFAGLATNKTLKILNLNRNQLTDAGMENLATVVFKGINVQKIYLSYNNIGGKGAGVLAEAIETYNRFTHVDLSWNNLYTPLGTFNLLSRFSENKVLQELNLSWNTLSGARLGTAVKNALSAPNLRHLNLSNNRLNGEAITNIIGGLNKAKKLVTLDLSYNPMTPGDALQILLKVKAPNIKVQKILMENVFVTGEFLLYLSAIKETKSKKNLVVTYGGVIGAFKGKGPDPRELILDRAEFLAKKPKKRPVDVALVAMQLLKDKNEIMQSKDFTSAMQASGAPLDNDLLDEMANIFAGPRSAKAKTIDVRLLVDYMKRKWPDRKLPPTPPPEPEPIPEPVPEPKAEKGKGKGKKK